MRILLSPARFFALVDACLRVERGWRSDNGADLPRAVDWLIGILWVVTSSERPPLNVTALVNAIMTRGLRLREVAA